MATEIGEIAFYTSERSGIYGDELRKQQKIQDTPYCLSLYPAAITHDKILGPNCHFRINRLQTSYFALVFWSSVFGFKLQVRLCAVHSVPIPLALILVSPSMEKDRFDSVGMMLRFECGQRETRYVCVWLCQKLSISWRSPFPNAHVIPFRNTVHLIYQ